VLLWIELYKCNAESGHNKYIFMYKLDCIYAGQLHNKNKSTEEHPINLSHDKTTRRLRYQSITIL